MFSDQNNKEKKKKKKKRPFMFITNKFRVFILKIKFSTKIISKLCLVSVWIGLSCIHVLCLHFFFFFYARATVFSRQYIVHALFVHYSSLFMHRSRDLQPLY